MTTKVTIEPTGHNLEVLITEPQQHAAAVVETRVVAAGAEPAVFYIYGTRVLTVHEIPQAPQA